MLVFLCLGSRGRLCLFLLATKAGAYATQHPFVRTPRFVKTPTMCWKSPRGRFGLSEAIWNCFIPRITSQIPSSSALFVRYGPPSHGGRKSAPNACCADTAQTRVPSGAAGVECRSWDCAFLVCFVQYEAESDAEAGNFRIYNLPDGGWQLLCTKCEPPDDTWEFDRTVAVVDALLPPDLMQLVYLFLTSGDSRVCLCKRRMCAASILGCA